MQSSCLQTRGVESRRWTMVTNERRGRIARIAVGFSRRLPTTYSSTSVRLLKRTCRRGMRPGALCGLLAVHSRISTAGRDRWSVNMITLPYYCKFISKHISTCGVAACEGGRQQVGRVLYTDDAVGLGRAVSTACAAVAANAWRE